MKIVNLTQHAPTPAQVEVGVGDSFADVKELLGVSDGTSINESARKIAQIAQQSGAKFALIGGHPALVNQLSVDLIYRNITPVFAHSCRVSNEAVQPDGTVVKTQVFEHLGFWKPQVTWGYFQTGTSSGDVPLIENWEFVTEL